MATALGVQKAHLFSLYTHFQPPQELATGTEVEGERMGEVKTWSQMQRPPGLSQP